MAIMEIRQPLFQKLLLRQQAAAEKVHQKLEIAKIEEAIKPPEKHPVISVLETFTPIGVITKLPEGGEKVLEKVPEAFLGTVFPIVPFLTGKTPVQTLLEPEQERQIDINPLATPEQKEEAKDFLGEAWTEGKPQILGGGTNVFEVGGQALNVAFPEIKFPDLGKIGKYALYAGVALAGIYLLGKSFGGK